MFGEINTVAGKKSPGVQYDGAVVGTNGALVAAAAEADVVWLHHATTTSMSTVRDHTSKLESATPL